MPINSFLYPGPTNSNPYVVDNSCRFNRADSAYMHKTPGSAGDQQKFTFSFWIKRCGITTGTAMTIFDTEADDDNGDGEDNGDGDDDGDNDADNSEDNDDDNSEDNGDGDDDENEAMEGWRVGDKTWTLGMSLINKLERMEQYDLSNV